MCVNKNSYTGNGWLVGLWCINNISVISRRPVLLVGDTGVPGENHRPVPTGNKKKKRRHLVGKTRYKCKIQAESMLALKFATLAMGD